MCFHHNKANIFSYLANTAWLNTCSFFFLRKKNAFIDKRVALQNQHTHPQHFDLETNEETATEEQQTRRTYHLSSNPVSFDEPEETPAAHEAGEIKNDERTRPGTHPVLVGTERRRTS